MILKVTSTLLEINMNNLSTGNSGQNITTSTVDTFSLVSFFILHFQTVHSVAVCVINCFNVVKTFMQSTVMVFSPSPSRVALNPLFDVSQAWGHTMA